MDQFKLTSWPAASRFVTQKFGVNPAAYAQFGTPGHMGIDIGGTSGVTDIYAAADGKVSRTGFDKEGYGNFVYIKHNGNYTTIYAHLHSRIVKQGEFVTAGTVLGKMGSTGFSSGPHLHFEMRGPQGMPRWPRKIIDPTPFLDPLLGYTRPSGPYKQGWVASWVIVQRGELAQAGAGGVSLREGSSEWHPRKNIVPEGTMMIITGPMENGYFPVDVPYAALNEAPPTAQPKPTPEFPPMVSTVEGWGWAGYITVDASGNRGVVGDLGINLRTAPRRDASAIGVVSGGSSVTIIGGQTGEYINVVAAKNDFLGEINLQQTAPAQPSPGTLSAHGAVTGDSVLGWGWSQYLDRQTEKAIVGEFGINLRAKPNHIGTKIGVVKGLSVVTIVGSPVGEYTPVMVNRSDMLTIENSSVTVDIPTDFESYFTQAVAFESLESMTPNTVAGYAYAPAVLMRGEIGIADQFGINLRDAPSRTGKNIGFIASGVEMSITGPRNGEYVPVRVYEGLVEAPFGSAPRTAPTVTSFQTSPSMPSPEPDTPPAPAPVDLTPQQLQPPMEQPVFGKAKLGLHASASAEISTAEIEEFKQLRPGMIKILSSHGEGPIRQLATNHPDASWVVRAFLDFRRPDVVSAENFVQWTLPDTQRARNLLQGKDVVIELHNEPNLNSEGLDQTWHSIDQFQSWWIDVLNRYRQALPGERFLFPGLSPGPDDQTTMGGRRINDRTFLEGCRTAIDMADGLAMHAYWSNPHFPMKSHANSGTMLVDDYIRLFPNKPIWITECSNNLGDDWETKIMEYRIFWHEMQQRPSIQGITFFVASAAGDDFKHETWLGRNVASRLGAR